MVSIVLDALADGVTEQEILREYPTLTIEGVRAAGIYGRVAVARSCPSGWMGSFRACAGQRGQFSRRA